MRMLSMLLCLGAASCSPVPLQAAEFDKATNTVRMSPEEVQVCNAGGGCSIVSRQWLLEKLAEAARHGAEAARAEKTCRRETDA